MPVSLASTVLSLALSSPVPVANTRDAGKPESFCTCLAMMSQGFVITMNHNATHKAVDQFHRMFQFCQTAMVLAHDGAHTDDNDVAVLQVFISAASDFYPMGQIGYAIPQVLTLADDLLFLHIYQYQFVHNALDC